MGIDDASTAFAIQDPRAPSMHIRNITCIGATTNGFHFVSNDPADVASSQSANLDDMPSIQGCDVDTDDVAILAESYNQTDNPLVVSGTDFYGSGGAIEVSAAQDGGEPVRLSSLDCGGQSVSVQGARLAVSAVTNATWTSQSQDFGPRLIADDGSFEFTQMGADTSGGGGLADFRFSGNFELLDGDVTASVDRTTDSGAIVEATSLADSTGNGAYDTVEAQVVNTSDGTDAADGVTVQFVVHPRSP
jgi:hypothetical protein